MIKVSHNRGAVVSAVVIFHRVLFCIVQSVSSHHLNCLIVVNTCMKWIYSVYSLIFAWYIKQVNSHGFDLVNMLVLFLPPVFCTNMMSLKLLKPTALHNRSLRPGRDRLVGVSGNVTSQRIEKRCPLRHQCLTWFIFKLRIGSWLITLQIVKWNLSFIPDFNGAKVEVS